MTFSDLTDLTNLDLRLVCYDLTSTYFEGDRRPSERFASRAFGYSRDHRGDRPQIVIGLLVTTDGIPIAHHVFAGNTADVSTLPGVLDDLKARFGVGTITMVADRGLISEDNVKALSDKGFGHILPTRLHRDHDVAAVLSASTRPDASWSPCPEANSAVCEVTHDGRRFVVVASTERYHRDATRTAELVARTSAELRALEDRVRSGRLKDKAKTGQAAGRILAHSGVARLFDVEIGEASFVYHYDEAALDYEEQLLAGRYVLATSLSPAESSAPEVLRAYRRLLEVESTFRVLKNFIALRPVYHWTEARVRAHVAVCVLGALIEALASSRPTCADATCATLTCPTRCSHRGGRYASSGASEPPPSSPAIVGSMSSPGAVPCRPRSSPPSTSTPVPGTAPASADPSKAARVVETPTSRAPPHLAFRQEAAEVGSEAAQTAMRRTTSTVRATLRSKEVRWPRVVAQRMSCGPARFRGARTSLLLTALTPVDTRPVDGNQRVCDRIGATEVIDGLTAGRDGAIVVDDHEAALRHLGVQRDQDVHC